jgi:hypothetical protein
MNSRNKGHGYEREIVHLLRSLTDLPVARNLDQSRDGGGDIALPPFLFECKRRNRISVYEWIDQAATAAVEKQLKPVIICRGDHRENLVVMRLDDFLPLLQAALSTPASVAASPSHDGQG